MERQIVVLVVLAVAVVAQMVMLVEWGLPIKVSMAGLEQITVLAAVAVLAVLVLMEQHLSLVMEVQVCPHQ